MADPEPKRVDNKFKRIGTHDGAFHCDEALACYLLQLLPEFKETQIVRSRDPATLESCDIVVDVGAVFDASKHRYDHHQRSFTETMNSLDSRKPWKTRLSSAGLIYFHFGRRVWHNRLFLKVELLFDKVYANFIEEVDGVDNGVDQYDGEPRYQITTTISKRVGALNVSWNSKETDNDARFARAMQLVGSEFVEKVLYYAQVWMPARAIVEQALEGRFQVDASGEIMVLSSQCPWKSHLYELETTLSTAQQQVAIKYVLYADEKNNWRVQCVSEGENSFKNRLSLPTAWCGVRDDELSSLSGIPGCIFVHASGFIGGNKTYDGAVAMAKAGLASRQ